MESVLGIGGLFFRSKDPEALAAWYRDHLGINLVPTSYDGECWVQQGGTTVFSPFPQDSAYFGKDRVWMINFRVRSLEAIALQLQSDGINVTVDPEVYPNGRFARLQDPEGNPIELWEEKSTPPAAPPP